MRTTGSLRAWLLAAAASLAGCELAVTTDGLAGGSSADATDAPFMDGTAPTDAMDRTAPTDATTMDAADAAQDAPGVDGADVADAPGPTDAPPDAPSGPTLVQQITGTASGVFNTTLTLPAAPANGDALILVAANTDTAPATVSGGGVTWTSRASSGTHVVVTVWTGFGVASGSPSVTLTWLTNTVAFAGILSEWRGISSFLIAQPANGTTNAITTSSLSALPGQLVFAAAGMHGPTEGDTVTSLVGGFTPLPYPAIDDVTALGAYLVPPSANLYQAQWSQSVTDGWDAVILQLSP